MVDYRQASFRLRNAFRSYARCLGRPGKLARLPKQAIQIDVSAMRLLVGLCLYLVAVVTVGVAAAGLYSVAQPGVPTATVRHETTATASPRIQAWLERKAEGVAFAEKEKAAALADRERAEALRTSLAATPEPSAAPRPRESEKPRAAERERGTRAKQVRREVRKQLRQLQTQTVYGYAPQRRQAAYPDEFLTRRDRYGY